MTRAAVARVDDGAMPPWLADVVADAAAAATVEDIAARLAPLFGRTRWLETLTEQWLRSPRARAGATASPPATRNGPIVTMTLAATPPVRLMLTLIEGVAELAEETMSGARTISFSGMHALYRLLSSRPVDATLGYAPPDVAQCRSRSILLRPGGILSLDERRLALRIAPQARPVLLLRARIERAPSPPQRRYDLDTGARVGMVQGDDGFARSAMLLSVLRAAGAQEAVPVMIAMLARDDASERWTVMRELLALDARVGWPHLDAMAAHDPAPDVRAAAGETLARLTPTLAGRAMRCPA